MLLTLLPVTTIIDSGDCAIACHERPGNEVTIFLAHANGFCARMWEPVIAHLPGTWRVLAPDLRGHGESSSPPPTSSNYAWEKYAGDILTVISQRKAAPVVGVGHSMGAAALVLAADEEPASFSSLFLFEPIIMAPDYEDAESPLADQARRRREFFASRDAARVRLGQKAPFMFWAPEVFDIYIQSGLVEEEEGVRLACRREVEAVNYEMGSAHDGFAALSRIAMPVTLAAGSRSPKEGPIATAPLARIAPHVTYIEFEGRTHFGPFEDPRLCAAEIKTHVEWARSSKTVADSLAQIDGCVAP